MNVVTEREILSSGVAISVIRARPSVTLDRDPRSMNRMDAETKLIHSRLTEWANFVKGWAAMLGYPAESYYHKWALLKIAPHPGHPPQMSSRVERVDGAVARLCEIDKSVIVRYYLQWRPENIWKGLPGIRSQHNFDIVLKRARWRVDGYLLATEEKDL